MAILFLTNYTYNVAIGQIPSCTMSYASSNLKFDLYDINNRPSLPSVKLGVDNPMSPEKFALIPQNFADAGHATDIPGDIEHIFNEHHLPEISVVKPGDVKARIIKTSGGRGGAALQYILAAVQNVSINLPIPRQDIYGMGSNYIFDRKLKLPVIGEISIDMVLRGYDQDEVDSFLTEADVFEIKIDHPLQPRIRGEVGDTYIASGYYFVAIEKDTWKRTAFVKETRLAGFEGDKYISEDGNFLFQCIEATEWLKVPLVDSDLTLTGYQEGDFVTSNTFIHVYTNLGWKKFAVMEVKFEDMQLNESLDIANHITYDLNRAQLKSQNYTHSIGSDVMVSSTLTFDVTENDGMRLYFRFIPRYAPSWVVKSETIQYTENDVIELDYDKNIDKGDSKVHFNLMGEDANKFYLNEDLSIKFINPPDYETQNKYELKIFAINDAGSDYKYLTINIEDVEVEVVPSWPNESKIVEYYENSSDALPYTFDLIYGDGAIFYTLSGDDASLFSIDENAVIYFNDPPDYETKNNYNISVIATNSLGSNKKDLIVNILNVVDIPPAWNIPQESISFVENSTSSISYDTGIFEGDGVLTYSLAGLDQSSFYIDSETGETFFITAPDYESKNQYTLSIVASNSIGSTTKELVVSITDTADIAPVWSSTEQFITYQENDTSNIVYDTTLNSGDTGITYALSGVDAPKFFNKFCDRRTIFYISARLRSSIAIYNTSYSAKPSRIKRQEFNY